MNRALPEEIKRLSNALRTAGFPAPTGPTNDQSTARDGLRFSWVWSEFADCWDVGAAVRETTWRDFEAMEWCAHLNEWSAYRGDNSLAWQTNWLSDNLELIQATVKGAGLAAELLATRIRLTRSVPQELQDFLAVLATKGYREWRNSGPATSFDNRSFTWTGPGPDFEFTCERSEWTVDVGRKPSREILQKHGIQSPADEGLGLRRYVSEIKGLRDLLDAGQLG